jgi:hypothetical protein
MSLNEYWHDHLPNYSFITKPMKYIEPTTPFEAAVQLIEPYVVRGDDPRDIQRSFMGAYCGTWGAEVRGNKIRVRRVDGKECDVAVSFREIYQFIKSRSKQPSLFAK